jgi:hypothetical protein
MMTAFQSPDCKGAVLMILVDTEGDEDLRGGADALVRAGPPGPATAEPGGSAAGQGSRPTNSVFNRAVHL